MQPSKPLNRRYIRHILNAYILEFNRSGQELKESLLEKAVNEETKENLKKNINEIKYRRLNKWKKILEK